MAKMVTVALALVLAAGLVFGIPFRSGPAVDIKSDFVSRPTFYKKSPVGMDGGKLLFIGHSAQWDEQYVWFYDFATGGKVKYRAPLKEYFSARTGLLLDNSLVRIYGQNQEASFNIEEVHFVDSARSVIGIEVSNYTRDDRQRRFLMFWEYKANRIIKTVLLSEGKKFDYWTYPAGYDMASGTFYFAQAEPSGAPDIRMDGGGNGDGKGDSGNQDGGGGGDGDNNRDGDGGNRDGDSGRDGNGPQEGGDSWSGSGDGIQQLSAIKGPGDVSVYGLSMTAVRRLARFVTANKLNKAEYDPAGKRVFVTEYTEGDGANKFGYLVDLAAGGYKRMQIPNTPYGVAFEGGTIYVASSSEGVMWSIDAVTGKKTGQVWCGSHGHVLGHVKPGVLVWVQNGSLTLFRTPGMVRTEIIPTTRFYTGFCHVDGSTIVGNRVILVNGDELKVISF